MTTKETPMTETRFIRHTFNDKERLKLAAEMANAESLISAKVDELKEVSAGIKAEIAEQESIMHRCAEQLRNGYEMRARQCILSYKDNNAIYTDKETGEILEEHPMTDEEQLKLNGQRIDAETVIRQSHEEE